MEKKVVIGGCRDYADYAFFKLRIDEILQNEKMVEHADLVIAFWDGKSKGTKSLINYAKSSNKEIIKIDI